MEKIEQMKANAAKWEMKSKELAYKKQLIAEYEKLKTNVMSKKKMLKYYPDMAGFTTDKMPHHSSIHWESPHFFQ